MYAVLYVIILTLLWWAFFVGVASQITVAQSVGSFGTWWWLWGLALALGPADGFGAGRARWIPCWSLGSFLGWCQCHSLPLFQLFLCQRSGEWWYHTSWPVRIGEQSSKFTFKNRRFQLIGKQKIAISGEMYSIHSVVVFRKKIMTKVNKINLFLETNLPKGTIEVKRLAVKVVGVPARQNRADLNRTRRTLKCCSYCFNELRKVGSPLRCTKNNYVQDNYTLDSWQRF